MEIVLGLISLAVTIGGLALTRTDRLLKEIRDVLIQIRDQRRSVGGSRAADELAAAFNAGLSGDEPFEQ